VYSGILGWVFSLCRAGFEGNLEPISVALGGASRCGELLPMGVGAGDAMVGPPFLNMVVL
jgi:hypothetical protein